MRGSSGGELLGELLVEASGGPAAPLPSGGLAALLPSGGIAAPFPLSLVAHQPGQLARVVIRQELAGQNKTDSTCGTLERLQGNIRTGPLMGSCSEMTPRRVGLFFEGSSERTVFLVDDSFLA